MWSVECAGGKRCPYGGWVHLKCAGIEESEEELKDIVYYCELCKYK